MNTRVGIGFDIHPFSSEPRALVLGGHVVDDRDGLEGHSDADVVAHAVTDALLGALALGDLGSFFGVDTPELTNAVSMGLLGQAAQAVAVRGFEVANLDCVVIAQRPHLATHIQNIRASLAKGLSASIDAVSVKATTTDRLGSIGRGEGIACWASVLVSRIVDDHGDP